MRKPKGETQEIKKQWKYLGLLHQFEGTLTLAIFKLKKSGQSYHWSLTIAKELKLTFKFRYGFFVIYFWLISKNFLFIVYFENFLYTSKLKHHCFLHTIILRLGWSKCFIQNFFKIFTYSLFLKVPWIIANLLSLL